MQDHDDFRYLRGSEANQFRSYCQNAFRRCEELGPEGALQQADIVFNAWKRLSPSDNYRLSLQLSRRYEILDLQFLLELGQRRARASAVVAGIAASTQLHVISQPAEVFDRFLAVASRQSQMRAHAISSEIIQSTTFPRDLWLGHRGDGK